jgi:hypothetical protein
MTGKELSHIEGMKRERRTKVFSNAPVLIAIWTECIVAENVMSERDGLWEARRAGRMEVDYHPVDERVPRWKSNWLERVFSIFVCEVRIYVRQDGELVDLEGIV